MYFNYLAILFKWFYMRKRTISKGAYKASKSIDPLFFNHKIWANSEIRTFALSKRWGPQTHLWPPPPPPHFWKWGHVPTLPPFSYAPEYKNKTFILEMPLSRSVRIYSKRDVIYTIDRMAFNKTNTHDLQCTIKLIWLDVYWN